jgi:hypothetical protein
MENIFVRHEGLMHDRVLGLEKLARFFGHAGSAKKAS